MVKRKNSYMDARIYVKTRITIFSGLVFLLAVCRPCLTTRGELVTVSGSIRNDTESCHLDLQHITVTVHENADIGSIIFEESKPSYMKNTQRISIMDGNKDNMFRIAGNNDTVYLANYLNYDVCNVYYLLLSERETATHGDITECPLFNITVIVKDVIGWPPYFNETCAWPARQADEYPLPVTAYTDYGDTRSIYVSSNPYNIDYFPVPDLNNDQCDITLYFLRNSTTYWEDCNGTNIYIRKANDILGIKMLPYSDCKIYQTPDEIPEKIVKTLILHGRNITTLLAVTVPYFVYTFAEADVVEISWDNQIFKFKLKSLGCPTGKYGGFCENDCICKNGAACHAFNGACKCLLGWKGVACDSPDKAVAVTPKTISLPFGSFAIFTCQAFHVNIPGYIKDHWYKHGWGLHKWYINGKLVQPKYLDNVFSNEHMESTYSYSTLEVKHLWENTTGKYECRVRDQSGKEYSDTAYTYISGCQINAWGEKCENVCDCIHGVDCHRYSGCICSPGWLGKNCDEVCPNGMFGRNCSERCLCEAEGTLSCDTKSGRCTCADGFCGEVCEEKCSCYFWERAICNDTDGCVCLEVAPRPREAKIDMKLVIGVTLVVLAAVALSNYLIYFLVKRGKKYQRLFDEEIEINNALLEHLGRFDGWMLNRQSLKQTATLLGQGQFGQVHKGLLTLPQSKQPEDIAIKTLLLERRTYQCYVDFAHEIKCLIKLHGHPNIVTLRGIILQKDVKGFVMEYADEEDLHDHICQLGDQISRDTESELLKYIMHVTLGMQFMQKKKIVQRDLTSRNILLFGGGVAKISDFGLSRDVGESKGIYIKMPWAEGHGALPLKWMPPEFLSRGEFHFKSDVWSFGVLLWEVCTRGTFPFREDNAYQFIRKIAVGERLARPRSCSDEAYTLMLRCWQSPLMMRPSAEQLTNEIELLINGKGLFVNEGNTDLRLEPFDGIIE